MRSERGIKMKIKKLWLMVLTMVFAVMLSTLAYCATTSNKCGNNVNWTLSSDGTTLTISGSGAMYDYTYSSGWAPWYTNKTNIKAVVINNGVTSILVTLLGSSILVNAVQFSKAILPILSTPEGISILVNASHP
jgi:hypothetical protein